MKLSVVVIIIIEEKDYIGGSKEITIPAGVMSVSHRVSIVKDNIVECIETFTVNISSATTCGVTIGGVNNVIVTITDDDSKW